MPLSGQRAATSGPRNAAPPTIASCLQRLGIRAARPDTLPFGPGDVTAGSETELQAAVLGSKDDVDLPRTIAASTYFRNVHERARRGDLSPRYATRIEHFLDDNPEGVWENSWVRLPVNRLRPTAQELLAADLRTDRNDPDSRLRADIDRFVKDVDGTSTEVRVPISDLLRLALADVLDGLPTVLRATGARLLGCFLSDNTSPETSSFYVVPLDAAHGHGRALARETAARFLLSNLLLAYANQRFGLAESGQRATLFLAPNPPRRQAQLNGMISDSFYRQLFLSPCLAWEHGEAKFAYMALCHQVLSRSQLHAVAKLKEAGILLSDLALLPRTSTTSLANNGIHISLGSRRLGRLLADPGSGFGAAHEKMLGDLVIKVNEHFLPLFVGTYSAAPVRLAFEDFHAERALGFLPHELDFTHLRMLWRRWKKKARNRLAGRSMTPFGLAPLDRTLAAVFRLRGDLVPDFRLIDYLAALMSTEESPALDGSLDSDIRLKRDLEALGVFDASMSLYLPLKLRAFATMGFSGFEGRHYSLFPRFGADLGAATDLQQLITLFAYGQIAAGTVTHAHIPDTPLVESERRQAFFGAAAGVPTFYVRRDTGNRFLAAILERCKGTRRSRRYRGYVRVTQQGYCRALLDLLRGEHALLEATGLHTTLDDLATRLDDPRHASAGGQLLAGILDTAGGAKNAYRLKADSFNQAAERYYRTTLRQQHLFEALEMVEENLDTAVAALPAAARAGAEADDGITPFLRRVRTDLAADTLQAADIERLILLILATIRQAAPPVDAVLREAS